MRTRTWRRYITGVLALAAAALLLVGGFNFFVNPLGAFHAPVVEGFNDRHPAAGAFARVYKTEAIKRIKPDAVIVGNSRADGGLDPLPEYFAHAERPYNAALSAAKVEEQAAMLAFAQRVHPLRQAVVALDFLAFNALQQQNKQFDPVRLAPEALRQPRSFFNTYGTLLAVDTVVASIKHMRYMRRPYRYSYNKPNGHVVQQDVAWAVEQRGIGHRFQADPTAPNADPMDGFSFAYSDTPGDDTFRHYEAMLRLMHENNVAAVFLISPVHVVSFSNYTDKAREMESYWRSRLVEMNRAIAAEYGRAPFPLWDFSRPSSLTTEPIPPADDVTGRMQWFWDAGHYRPELGHIVLRKVMQGSTEHPDFGIRLE